jgi:membrane protein DedA with SNARE-associated domain
LVQFAKKPGTLYHGTGYHWATQEICGTAIGYFFGQAVTAFNEAFPNTGRYVLGALALAAFGLWLWRRHRKKRQNNEEER